MSYSEEWLAERLRVREMQKNTPSPRLSGKRGEALSHSVESNGRQRGTIPEKRKRKYRNVPTEVNGIWFASKKEAVRYSDLLLLQAASVIHGLRLQPKYEFIHDGVRIGSYKPDFEYVSGGTLVVEDVKSKTSKTTAYRLRKRMMLAFFGIEILET